jgi:hypothetical protein
MSDDAGGNADRDAFFAALGRVFQEYGDVSKGYAILNFARVTEMAGAAVENEKAIVRPGTGGTVVVVPGGGGLIEGAPGECIAITFNPLTGEDECIYFMSP